MTNVHGEIAVPALALPHWLLFATPFPFAIEPRRFLYVAISGLIGFVIGDTLLAAGGVMIYYTKENPT